MNPYVNFEPHTLSHPSLKQCSNDELNSEIIGSCDYIKSVNGKKRAWTTYDDVMSGGNYIFSTSDFKSNLFGFSKKLLIGIDSNTSVLN